MYLTHVQVEGSAEVRCNLYFQENTAILEVRTLATAYTYRIREKDKATTAEAIHCAWIDILTMFPFYAETTNEVEQYVFDYMTHHSFNNEFYWLERLKERPLVAPLPEKPAKTSKRRK